MVPDRIWPKPAPGAERSQTANTIIFRSKEKKTGSWSGTNKYSSQNKEQAPRTKRSLLYTLILGLKQKPGSQSRTVLDRIPQTIFSETKLETSGPGPQTQTKVFRLKQNRLPEPNGTQTRQNKKEPTKMKYVTEQQKQKEANEKRKLCPRDTWNIEYAKRGSSKTCNKTK